MKNWPLNQWFKNFHLSSLDITWKTRKQADSWVPPLGILIQQVWFRAWYFAFLTSSQVILTNDRWPTLCSWWTDKYSNDAYVRWLVTNFFSTAIFEEILVTIYAKMHRKKLINCDWLSSHVASKVQISKEKESKSFTSDFGIKW